VFAIELANAAPSIDTAATLAAPATSLLTSSGPTFDGCPVFPADNPYNRDVSNDPVDPHSAEYMQHMGAGSLFIHPDFGMPQYGLPFAVVGSGQPRVPMRFLYAGESDPGPYPFPLTVPIQGGTQATGDRHAIVFDTAECKLYETWNTFRSGSGFFAGSGAIFDLRSNALRPDGWTSATAAGLPLFPGLVRYDEVAVQGIIRHAISFEATTTAHAYVHPATHSTGTSSSPWAPPFGTRVRLKKSFDLSNFHGQSLVILKAMRTYGMILMDNHTSPWWSVGGAQDPRWNASDLQQLKSVPASAFEVVKLGAFHIGL
jgi:hypothetical protein